MLLFIYLGSGRDGGRRWRDWDRERIVVKRIEGKSSKSIAAYIVTIFTSHIRTYMVVAEGERL